MSKHHYHVNFIKIHFIYLINYSNFTIALAGCTAGILGLTGLSGFIFYIAALIVFFGLLIVKTGNTWNKYFISRKSLVTNGVSFN